MKTPHQLARTAVTIPHRPLEEQLLAADAIKAEMADILRRAEAAASEQPVTRPGDWRHHPDRWPR